MYLAQKSRDFRQNLANGKSFGVEGAEVWET